jgi:hypothetical protein
MRIRPTTYDASACHLDVIAGVLGADHLRNTRSGGRRRGVDGSGYSRAQFGPAWADTDHNGCDQRNDVLQRDLAGVRLKIGSRCLVASGVLHDHHEKVRRGVMAARPRDASRHSSSRQPPHSNRGGQNLTSRRFPPARPPDIPGQRRGGAC